MALLHHMFITCSSSRQHPHALVLRWLRPRQARPACHGLSAAPYRGRQQRLYQAASDSAEQAQQPSSSRQPQHQSTYYLVSQRGSRWRTEVSIPKTMLPGREKQTLIRQTYSNPEDAARAVDVLLLALHGAAAAAPYLNFQADSYSTQEIAEQQAALLSRYPDLQLGGAAGRPDLHRTHDPSGVRAAAARAADRVGGVYDGSSPLIGAMQHKDAPPLLPYRMRIFVGPSTAGFDYSLQPLTYLQAGCAYDMAHIVLYGRQHSVNFPPDTYSSSDIEAMRQDMQMMTPGIFAAAASRRGPPPPNYHNIQVGKAADAAVAAAAEEAVAAGYHSSFGRRYIRQQSTSFRVEMRGKHAHTPIRFSRTYDTALAAACAADYLRLALGKVNVNVDFNVYTAEGVAAMKAWMQLEAPRLAAAVGAGTAAATTTNEPDEDSSSSSSSAGSSCSIRRRCRQSVSASTPGVRAAAAAGSEPQQQQEPQ